MLQNIRTKTQGAIATVIFVLIAVSFTFWGMERYFEGGANGKNVVAKVGGEKVTQQAINAQYQRLVQSQAPGKTLSPTEQRMLKQEALSNITRNIALTQAANAIGLNASEDQVNAVIESDPHFQQNGRFSPQLFQSILLNNSYSPGAYINDIKNSMITFQMQSGVEQSAFVLPSELEQMYELIHQKRDMGYFTIATKPFLSQAKASDEQIKAYYKEHSAEFKTPEQVSVEYIQLRPEHIKQQLKVTDAALQEYYQNNGALYTSPSHWDIQAVTFPFAASNAGEQKAARTKVLAMAKALKQPNADFATAAKAQGQTVTTESIEQGKASPAYISMVQQLNKGEVSQPFQTDKGFTVIKLVAINTGQLKPFADVKDKVKAAVQKQQLDQALSQKNDALSNLTYTNPNSLEPAAKSLGLTVQSTGLFSRGAKKGDKSLVANPKIIAAAFSPDVLKMGNNSNVILLKDGSALVLRLKKHQAASVKPLSSVTNVIKQNVLRQQAEQKVQLKAKAVQQQLQKGVPTDQIAKDNNLVWHAAYSIARDNKKLPTAVINVAFQLQSPAKSASSPKAAVAMAPLMNGDIAVVKLSGVHAADFSKITEKEKATLTKNLQLVNGQLDFQLYAKSVLDQTKIKVVNPQH